MNNSDQILGVADLDLYPLCSNKLEKSVQNIKFHSELNKKPAPVLIRRISCTAEISSDKPILDDPIDSSFYINLKFICNLDEIIDENQQMKVGIMAPMGSQINKKIEFSTDLHSSSQKLETSLMKPYKYPLTSNDENLLNNLGKQTALNKLIRIIMSKESKQNFHNHIKNNLKIAIEVKSGEEHLIGFINLGELLQVGRKKNRSLVPLLKFSNELLIKLCGYQSVFFKPNFPPNERKSKKLSEMKKVKTKVASKSSLKIEQETINPVLEVLHMNKECQQVFIIIDLEFEKPLNEEVYEDSSEKLILDKPLNSSVTQNESQEKFHTTLDLITKNIFKIYDKETEVEKIITKMISDGYFSVVEDHLLNEMKLPSSSNENFADFKSDVICQLASVSLNRDHDGKKSDPMIAAKVFNYLRMEKQSDEIFLLRLHKNQCEQNWIDYAVDSLRKEKFGKALVCVDKAINCNSLSIIGHILQAYIMFKLEKYSESVRLIKFMNFKHKDTLEFKIILTLIDIKKGLQGNSWPVLDRSVLEEIQKVYKSFEVLWFATAETENLLSWHDPLVKSAIFFIKLGCFDFAELCLGEYYTKYGSNINYSYLLAVIDALKGDFKNSLIHLKKISIQDIGNHQVNFQKITKLKILMLMRLEKFDQAKLLFFNDPLAQEKKLENFLTIFEIGVHLSVIGELKKTTMLLEQAHSIFPTHLTSLELGKSYRRLNELSSAENFFINAVNDDDRLKDAWCHLYEIYLKQGRVELAAHCKKNFN